MAVDASSVSVVLGAPGQAGSSQVVTAAGLVFTQGAAPPASSPYWNYDGSNLVGNVPTGKGFSFTVNGSQVASISTAGAIAATTTVGALGLSMGNLSGRLAGTTYGQAFLQLTDSQAGPSDLVGSWIDGATSVGVRIAAFRDYTTPGARISSFGVNHGVSYRELAGIFAAPSANPTTASGQVFAGHIGGGTTALSLNTCRIGLGAGTTSSGTAVTASGHDIAGRIGVTVNSTGTANQPILLVAWATNYNTPPFVQLTPGNAATATAPLNTQPFAVATTSGFAVMGNATGLAAGTYVFNYLTVQ